VCVEAREVQGCMLLPEHTAGFQGYNNQVRCQVKRPVLLAWEGQKPLFQKSREKLDYIRYPTHFHRFPESQFDCSTVCS
jgi:hypothetical protein